MRQMTSDWQQWVAENVLLQNDPQSIISTLINNGFDSAEASREVSQAMSHPYIQAGKSMGRKLKKREWFLDIRRVLESLRPNASAVERVHKPSREEFFENYYIPNRPVIIEGALDHWKALTDWNPAYMKANFGDKIVEIQANRDTDPLYEINSEQFKKTLPFAEYIDTITGIGETNNYYITANNSGLNQESLKDVWKDIDLLPDYLYGNDPANKGFFWFGPAGTVTPLHHDLTNNFMAQVYGRKLIKLISPSQSHCVYNHKHCYSVIDMDNIDHERYPLFRDVKVIEIILNPGDLFFLPVGWWHYVRGLDITMTMTFTNFLLNNNFSSFYHTYSDL